ncbi:hypothetical protein GQ43DRAFT_30066 [Delitschia confertaspora ATCC 74209]|uniref:Uncharacterized protein n=1 Tax=Delitschia confertaspora ATCC 74209 TaxID=1513339 RepID=A0A9P4MQC1_9PLEO|nr:hypothetical protein GQ43DRAFT_30066 [Delitschia confertaspora ATCC 74209]
MKKSMSRVVILDERCMVLTVPPTAITVAVPPSQRGALLRTQALGSKSPSGAPSHGGLWVDLQHLGVAEELSVVPRRPRSLNVRPDMCFSFPWGCGLAFIVWSAVFGTLEGTFSC